MAGYYDRHDDSCVVWETPLDQKPQCNCLGWRRIGGELPKWPKHTADRRKNEIADALDLELSTEEIAAIYGIQSVSLLTWVRKNADSDLHARMLEVRQAEYARGSSFY